MINKKKRISTKVRGSKDRPRLSVYRSNKHIFVQVIDDVKGETIIGISDKEVSSEESRVEKAKKLGMLLAKKALEKKVSVVVFDKGRYAYHGLVKALAEGAREGGLKF
jgi:large subunit ribosomal protein L18